jgi:lipopolysaccharide/colanic/teichoic acid biosynthesis glycosyltransferase
METKPMEQLDSPSRPLTSSAASNLAARAGVHARRASLRLRLWLRDRRPIARRALDVVASALGLVLIAPVLLLAITALKVESRGPALFTQERVGRAGRSFRMYKLRSMYVDAESRKAALAKLGGGIRFKLRRDPRVTTVGRILRKYSIDELPQLFNVLRGDMTLIGPRPAIWSEVNLYDTRALRRLEVPQGLTCLWQVGGRSDLSFEKQVDLDLQFIDAVDGPGELSILLRTIPAVITGRGAY